MITLIAAMGKNREIGKDNALLWDLPVDMQHFRSRTKEKTVVMGRKTFESIGRPLPKRKNIVLTKSPKFTAEGVFVLHSIEDILQQEKNAPEEEIMVIGGSMIYQLFLPYATHISCTVVNAEFPNADSFFPAIQEEEWSVIEKKEYTKDEQHQYGFTIYEMERRR